MAPRKRPGSVFNETQKAKASIRRARNRTLLEAYRAMRARVIMRNFFNRWRRARFNKRFSKYKKTNFFRK